MSSNFQPPPWVSAPKLDSCGLRVMKDGKTVEILKTISTKACTLFGRNAGMCDHKLDHPSISRRHSLIAHGSSGNIYLVDLASTHGTFKNTHRLPPHKREVLADNDIIQFGASTREYIFKFDVIGIDDVSKLKKFKSQSTITEDDKKESKNGDEKHSNKRSKMEGDSKNDDRSVKRQKKDLTHVSCYHLLIKHKDSRRPTSWKTKIIIRSRDEAKDIVNKFREEICSVKDPKERIAKFSKVAKVESDCNSAKRGGDLGSFGKKKMQRPFEKAAFNLEIGEICEAIETDSGVHIILRVA